MGLNLYIAGALLVLLAHPIATCGRCQEAVNHLWNPSTKRVRNDGDLQGPWWRVVTVGIRDAEREIVFKQPRS